MKRVNTIIRCLRQRLRSDQSGFTLPELLIAIVISGIIVGALASAFGVSARAMTASHQRLDESHDAQQASAYFVADAANASYFSATTVPSPAMASCPAFGASTVAVFEWTEAGIRKDALYGTAGTPMQLLRRYCESGVQQYEVSLVKNVGSPAPAVTCPTAPCSATSNYLELGVHEKSNNYDYTLRADPRTTAPGPAGPMNGIAVYVGGTLTLGGTNTNINVPIGSVVVGGVSFCNSGSSLTAADGFYGNSPACTGQVSGTLPADPLAGAVPQTDPGSDSTTAPPNNNYTPPVANDCGSMMPTYLPGRYPNNNKMANGCLAAGKYYFTSGATFSNLKAADAGVQIFIAGGDIDLSGATTLKPMTSDDSHIALWAETGNIKTNDGMTINGYIYAPAGQLWVASDSGALTTGGVDVTRLRFSGNSSGLIILGI
jgi:prepilin-type N-terminal cleavage/methylation domain-containing protein